MNNLNKKRFFAFGCSYTNYNYATWADFIGSNFDFYINEGKPGACNNYIMNRFVELDTKYNFNSDDYVAIMFTHFNRFSFYSNENRWHYDGNITKCVTPDFLEKMWSVDWSIYNSWIDIHIIKTILTAKNIEHKLMVSFSSKEIIEDTKLYGIQNDRSIEYFNEFYNLLDVKIDMDSWLKLNYNFPIDFYKRGYTDDTDDHPTQKMHYAFFKEFFQEFNTEKAKDFFDLSEKSFVHSNEHCNIFKERMNLKYKNINKKPLF